MRKTYPKWIDEYTKSAHRFFRGMDIRTFEPFDCFHFHPLHSDLWQEHIYQAIRQFKTKKIPFPKAVQAFPNPSSIRAMFEFMVCHYNNIIKDKIDVDKKKIRETFNFFIKVLKGKIKKDIFGYRENIGHSKGEITKILREIKWSPGSSEVSKEIGKLYLGANSLVNGLMNDWCTDNGVEVWGPYNISKYYGSGTILVIKEFPCLKPIGLWPQVKNYKYNDIKIYSIYRKVKMRVEFCGCHTVYQGNLAKNLVKYAVVVDGKYVTRISTIRKMAMYVIKLAQSQYQRVRRMDFESLKKKVIAQELYQLKDFFKLVNMDYRPHPVFKRRLKGKKLLKGRYPLHTIGMSLKEIDRRFGIDDLKKLYTK